MDLWRMEKIRLENRIIDLEIENDELREERDELARNLRAAIKQIQECNKDRNYPDLRVVSEG